MRVVIGGGGTAGHIYPGLALARALKAKRKDVEVLFVGTSKGPASIAIAKEGYVFKPLNVKSLKRKISFELVATFFYLGVSFFQALKTLREFKPDMVVGMGGYASFPTVVAAILTQVPTLIHEQNALPGLANRILGRFVSRIAVSFPGTEKFFPCGKAHLTGNPVREEIISAKRNEAVSYFNLDKNRKTLLIFGGSQGARQLNQAFLEAYDKLRHDEKLQVIVATGTTQYESVVRELSELEKPDDKILLRCFPYIERMNLAYAACDLVLSRAGAISIAEITAVGVPSILVPYPHASGGHQEKNARHLESQRAAKVILDSDLNGLTLYEAISRLVCDEEKLSEMRKKALLAGKPKAAEELAELVEELFVS